MSGGVLPDLRYSSALGDAERSRRSCAKARCGAGNVAFGAELSAADVEQIRAYVIRRAHESQRSGTPAAAAKILTTRAPRVSRHIIGTVGRLPLQGPRRGRSVVSLPLWTHSGPVPFGSMRLSATVESGDFASD